ncbi:MAG: outer membrane protein assembly factor BamA [Bacteroidota bacterium]
MNKVVAFFVFTLGVGIQLGVAQNTFEITDPTKNLPKEYNVLEVSVEGNETVREKFILNSSLLGAGAKITYPGDAIPNAIKNLYRSGLFSDVQIFITEQTLTDLKLLIKVVEQPRILEYKLEGIKRSQRRDLKDQINILPGVAVTDGVVIQAKNIIRKFYRERGHWDTKVTHRIEESERAGGNRVILIFDIEPGKKFEVKEIFFEGNEAFSDRKLVKKMKPLKVDKWWKFLSKKVYKKADFEEGRDKVIAAYQKKGYMDVFVKSDTVYTFDYRRGRKTGVKVGLSIIEGPQYKIRNITWDGNTVYTDEQLNLTLGFQKGDFFDQEKFDLNLRGNQASSDVTALYQNIGYLFFQVFPTITKVGQDSLDIQFDIYEDEIATIRQVSFSGNTKTHDDVVRRTLRTVPGNTYSREAIIRTIRELSTLGYFDPQNIEPGLFPLPQEKEVDIEYDLDESASTDNFEFSGGYGGRGVGAIVSARLNFNNFSLARMFERGGWNPIPSGDGQQVSLGVQVTGSGFQSYTVGFVEPWLKGKPTSLGLNLNYSYINFTNSDERNILFSSGVTVGRRLKFPDDYFSQRVSLRYELYDVVGGATFLAEGNSNLMILNNTFERNSLDNFISPNSGSKITFQSEVALPLPEFSEFYKLKFAYQHHVPLTEKLIITSIAEYGYIGYLTETRRSNFQRFLMGGTQLQQQQNFLTDNIDLRGYPGGNGGSIAPFVDGEQIAGRIYNKYAVELRYPAVASEQLQVIPYSFVDAGNTFLDFETYNPFNVRRSTGFGVRLFLPILGLVDLSYGYRLDGIPGTNIDAGQWEFLFNIGSPF